MDRDWANLPVHLLDSVVERLVSSSHYMKFSLVCKPWYKVAKDNKDKHATHRVTAPLMLKYTGREDYWKLYNVGSDKFLDLQVRVPKVRLCGSSKGWLMFVEKNVKDRNFGVTLVNPFLRVKGREENHDKSFVRLPPLTPPGWRRWFSNCGDYVCKASISADPILNPKDCVVMVILRESRGLAFIRLSEDTTWTYMDETFDNVEGGCRMIEEVVYIGNKFYVVNQWNELLSFDVTSWSYSNVKLVVPATPPVFLIKRYIFEGENKELLMVQRYMDFERKSLIRYTKTFRVFHLNFHKGEWTEKNTLDGGTLFVGDNTSIYVSSPDSGFQSNCIYFNHDDDPVCDNGPDDFGVYNVVEQSFVPYPVHVKTLIKGSRPMPIWVIPSCSFTCEESTLEEGEGRQ